MSVKLSLGAILVCSKSSFLNWFLWSNVCLYPQEMASSLAQKHLRSIILNVSIKSETQTLKRSRAFIWWLLSFPSTLNNSHWKCQELFPIKLPKTLVIHNTCFHPPLRLYSVGVWWLFRPLNKELVTIWKLESFTHLQGCDTEPANVIWGQVYEVEQNLLWKWFLLAFVWKRLVELAENGCKLGSAALKPPGIRKCPRAAPPLCSFMHC